MKYLDENEEKILQLPEEKLTEMISCNLHSDCKKCFGLCCVALYFSASDSFPVDKTGGQPCQNLQSDFRCSVYNDLRELGLKGCTIFDCFGAGQKVSQVSFYGKDWMLVSNQKEEMFQVFQTMRQLHELLWYLTEALSLQQTQPIHGELVSMLGKTEKITYLAPREFMELDLAKHRTEVDKLLIKASELVRAEYSSGKRMSSKRQKKLAGRLDFIGADLTKADLRGANLRGAYLMACDLRDGDLSGVDLIGADLRDADLRGTDLRKSIFLTQAQINAGIGDSCTKLPSSLILPAHWISLEEDVK